MPDKEDPQIQDKNNRCPKCRGFNTLIVGEGKDRSFYCLDCDYAEGVGV